jgi:hypothetical protein
MWPIFFRASRDDNPFATPVIEQFSFSYPPVRENPVPIISLVYQAHQPPSTGMVTPVTASDIGEAR